MLLRRRITAAGAANGRGRQRVPGRERTVAVALPPLTENGELPLGVHAASLREVLERFGVGSAQRKVLALRVARVYRVAQATGHLGRFVVFGSFVTNKLEPQDVDVFLVMADTFDASNLRRDARLLFDHGAAQAHFGASGFWKRDGGRRGIVEIISEAS